MAEIATDRIVYTSGIRGGKACISGTRISVSDIVIWTEQAQSPDEIVTDYPQLSLADVHSALAHYYSHQTEIDQQIRNSEAFAADLKLQLESSDVKEETVDGDSVSS
jgi:uncharacterized protein (DUF433 family)